MPSSPSTPPKPVSDFVDSLFTNGAGEKANRLVLTVDSKPPRDLGGWCRGAVEDRFAAALRAREEEVERLRAAAARMTVRGWRQASGCACCEFNTPLAIGASSIARGCLALLDALDACDRALDGLVTHRSTTPGNMPCWCSKPGAFHEPECEHARAALARIREMGGTT